MRVRFWRPDADSHVITAHLGDLRARRLHTGSNSCVSIRKWLHSRKRTTAWLASNELLIASKTVQQRTCAKTMYPTCAELWMPAHIMATGSANCLSHRENAAGETRHGNVVVITSANIAWLHSGLVTSSSILLRAFEAELCLSRRQILSHEIVTERHETARNGTSLTADNIWKQHLSLRDMLHTISVHLAIDSIPP